MATALMEFFGNLELPYRPTCLVVEWQRLRPRGEPRPNNIVDLCGFAGMCLTAASMVGAVHTFAPIPSEWKGQVPKAVHQERIIRRIGLTSDLTYVNGTTGAPLPGAEKIPASMRTHVIDAIGLACWACDPYGPLMDIKVAERAAKEKR
jgi:hypothetical protein